MSKLFRVFLVLMLFFALSGCETTGKKCCGTCQKKTQCDKTQCDKTQCDKPVCPATTCDKK